MALSPEEWLSEQNRQIQTVPVSAPMPTEAEKAAFEKEQAKEPLSPEEWLAQQPKAAPTVQPEVEAPAETSLEGIAGAITRGVAPIATGAALGAAAGLPFAGVGAIPGAIAGAGAAALTTLVGDPIIGSINSLLGTKYSIPSEAMEDLLTRIGVAEPRTAAERIVQTTAAGAAGAGGMAATGKAIEMAAGVASPITRAVGSTIAAQPVAQVAGGAGAGLAGQVASEMGAGPVGQIAASLAGGVTGAKLAGTKITPSATRVPSEIVDAERAGVSLMTSDVLPPRTFASKWLQTVGERIPLAGTGGVRESQQKQRIEAVRNLLVDFGADDAAKASDDVMRDVLSKRAGELSKYSTAKTEVIERLGQSGVVPVNRTIQAIDNEIAKLQGAKTKEFLPIIERLNDWKASLQGQNLVNVEVLRKQIGESFKAPELASVRGTGEKALTNIYKPLKQDMESFITQVGERRDITKYKVANKRLSDLAGELDNNTLKSVLKRGDATPEVIANMLFSKKPSDVKQLYASLTPAGRERARSAILARAAEKSSVEVSGGFIISPDKFAGEVKRLGASIGVFFNGDDLKQVEGLTKVLNITKRASEAAAMPTTGVQVAIPAGAAALSSFFGAGLTGFLGTLGAATVAGGAARIYESAPVRNLLIKISQTVSGSAEEAALLKRLTSTIQQQQQAQSSEENK
jgi:hypothetical protein